MEKQTLDIGGLTIAYTDTGPAHAETIVLLVHGIPTSSHLYRNVQTHLGPGIRSIALDLPGYGDSDKPADLDYSLRSLSEQFGRFKKALLGDRKVHLVIHDIGGPIGLGWLLNHPDEVQTLTILNTTVFLEHFRPPLPAAVGIMLGLIPFVGARLLARLMPQPILRRALKREFKHDISEADLQGYVDPLSTYDAQMATAKAFTGYTRSFGFLTNLRKRLNTIDVPTQVVFGDHDAYCRPPNGRAFADRIDGATFEALEGVGHFCAEEVPKLVAARIMRIVDGARSSGDGSTSA
jgi:pimeloyl-ACP methyl ester carboxylesterase